MHFLKKIIVIVLVLLISPVSADVFIYHSPSYYNVDSDRLSSVSNGIYLSGDSLEFGYEKTNLEFKNGLMIQQEDSTLVWKRYFNKTLLRLGLHYAASDEVESNGKTTFILEVLHYSKDIFGNSIYFTRYRNDTDVWQLSSRVGRYYNPSFLPGRLYLQIQGDVILVNSLTASQSYFTLDLNSHLQVNSWWGLELGGWFGEKRSAVSGSGFVVYNLNDLYEGEVRLRSDINISKNTKIKLGLQVNSRRSPITQVPHFVRSFLVGMSYTF